jgi:hypothetical protein
MKALTLLLPWLLFAGAAAAQADLQRLTDRLAPVQGRWMDGRLLQPLRSADTEAADLAWAAEVRAAVLEAVQRWDGPQLLQTGALSDLLSLAAQTWKLDDGVNLQASVSTGLVPRWLQDAVRQQVSRQSLPARRLDKPSPAGEWMGAARWTEPGRLRWDLAAVWSGPAVRDGVAVYRNDGADTRIRLAIGDSHELWQLAQARGVAVRMALDDAGQPLPWGGPLPIHLELQVPVWLVTPQALLPAMLTAMRSGDSCQGGYVEVRVAGDQQPPVWAVLFLPDEAAGRAARIRRLAPPPQPEGQSASGKTSRLELSWPDRRLPTLHLVAKQFGDLWGTYVELADHPPAGPGRLSAAGSPECVLR